MTVMISKSIDEPKFYYDILPLAGAGKER